jgi:ABC-type bacteriocin/lantibiotic exporter with double-glycine peptidase domain
MMNEHAYAEPISLRKLFGFVARILGPESNFYYLTVIYGLGISLLSLATPISVQMLINTVANTGLTVPLTVLSITLFALLLAAGLMNALRIHLMDLFARRFYARMVGEIALRAIYALNPFFQDQDRGTLFNRYFDIIVVHKSLPYILIGGFTVVLQTGMGFVLVSLYHPLFLAFNLVIVVLIWAIWLAWGPRAIRSAVLVSHKKHATAAWLEGLGESNGFYKSERHIASALDKTNAATDGYLKAHARHFRHHFAQTLSFLLLYATASAALLGLGGWLVIQGELSLGQLVAAELVLSAAFYGVSQLGIYLTYFYDLCAAVDELSLFYEVEQEECSGEGAQLGADSRLELVAATGDARGCEAELTFAVPSGARVMGIAESHGVQRLLTHFLRRHAKVRKGYVALGGVDIQDIDLRTLRKEVIILDRPTFSGMSIRDYLDLTGRQHSSARDLEVLRLVGLDRTMAQLRDGLDTRLSPTGWPLSITECMQLKLAASIIAQPRVLVLTQLFDVLSEPVLRRSLERLQENSRTTVIYFTGRQRDLGFDAYLYLGRTRQSLCDSLDPLLEQLDDEICEGTGPRASAPGLLAGTT